LNAFSLMLMVVNSSMNIVFYGLFNNQFRKVAKNLFFKGESLSNFTSSVRRPTHRRYSTTKIDKNGDTDIELVATKESRVRIQASIKNHHIHN